MLVEEITLVDIVFAIVLYASLASIQVLAMVLAVRWGFFALEGCCCSEGCLGGAQVKLVPEDLGDFESVWNFIGDVLVWGHHGRRFDGVGPRLGKQWLDLFHCLKEGSGGSNPFSFGQITLFQI